MRYRFNIDVDAASAEEAVLVMASRTDFDEEVEDPRTGTDFPYTIDWSNQQGPQYDELVRACDIFFYEPEPAP